MRQRLDIGIIGGGILGLTLSYRLLQRGHTVTVYERDPSVGGLVRSILIDGISVDRFYHVILKSDRNWIGLITELGLADRLYFRQTHSGVYRHGRVHPVSTVSEFFRLPFLSMSDRVRLAWTLQQCRWRQEWRSLDDISIEQYLASRGQERLFQSFWEPLLRAKFDGRHASIPMTYIWSRARRMASTRTLIRQREIMGHINGNLQSVVDELEHRIRNHGGVVRTGTGVDAIATDAGVVSGVVLNGEQRHHDVVVATIPYPQYQGLLPESLRNTSPKKVEYLGVVSILLMLKSPLTTYHTLNLIDDGIPYTAIIETTNVIEPALVGGRHLVYIPKYLAPENRHWSTRSDEDLRSECFEHLTTMFPGFDQSNVVHAVIHRERFVEPLYTIGFHRDIPPLEGPVPGLFVVNNSHTYPFLLNCESIVSLAGRAAGIIADPAGLEPRS
jgi:protoporphyrinogen oxidase